MFAYQILHFFFEFFYYLLRWVQIFNGLNIAILLNTLINSKKIPKNVKFDLQVHFNISIMLNVWIDYLNFENFENRECKSVSPKKCN